MGSLDGVWSLEREEREGEGAQGSVWGEGLRKCFEGERELTLFGRAGRPRGFPA